jgi:hypothetical protein
MKREREGVEVGRGSGLEAKEEAQEVEAGVVPIVGTAGKPNCMMRFAPGNSVT